MGQFVPFENFFLVMSWELSVVGTRRTALVNPLARHCCGAGRITTDYSVVQTTVFAKETVLNSAKESVKEDLSKLKTIAGVRSKFDNLIE